MIAWIVHERRVNVDIDSPVCDGVAAFVHPQRGFAMCSYKPKLVAEMG